MTAVESSPPVGADPGGYVFDRRGAARLYRFTLVAPPVLLLVALLADWWRPGAGAHLTVVGMMGALGMPLIVVNEVLLRAAARAGGTDAPRWFSARGIGSRRGRACWRAAGERLRHRP